MNFSKLYDLFQKDVDYESLLAPILQYLNKEHLILDAGCGSGHILSHLLIQGYDVIGFDNDETMLEIALKNIDETYGQSRLFFHDLRKPLNHKFHQIISLLDVFHYFKGIKGVSQNLYNALYDGGKLILDLYKEPQNTRETGELYDMEYAWQVETRGHKLEHNIQVTTKDNTQNFRIKQFYFPLEYYFKTLASVGFKIETFDGFDDRKVYLVCTK